MLYIENKYVQSENHISPTSTNEIEELNSPRRLTKSVQKYFDQKAKEHCVVLVTECRNSYKQTQSSLTRPRSSRIKAKQKMFEAETMSKHMITYIYHHV